MPGTRFRHSSTFSSFTTLRNEERENFLWLHRPPEMIKLRELPLFMFSSSGTFGVTVTGRMTNKQGLKKGLNPEAAGLVTKCMNSVGHKHRPHLTLFLHLKSKGNILKCRLPPWNMCFSGTWAVPAAECFWGGWKISCTVFLVLTSREGPSLPCSISENSSQPSFTPGLHASGTLREPRRNA